LIPSQQLNVALPLPIYTMLTAHLYSELEGRVPLGHYARFLAELLNERLSGETLDLAPWIAGVASGTLIISGTPEAIAAVRRHLSTEAS